MTKASVDLSFGGARSPHFGGAHSVPVPHLLQPRVVSRNVTPNSASSSPQIQQAAVVASVPQPVAGTGATAHQKTGAWRSDTRSQVASPLLACSPSMQARVAFAADSEAVQVRTSTEAVASARTNAKAEMDALNKENTCLREKCKSLTVEIESVKTESKRTLDVCAQLARSLQANNQSMLELQNQSSSMSGALNQISAQQKQDTEHLKAVEAQVQLNKQRTQDELARRDAQQALEMERTRAQVKFQLEAIAKKQEKDVEALREADELARAAARNPGEYFLDFKEWVVAELSSLQKDHAVAAEEEAAEEEQEEVKEEAKATEPSMLVDQLSEHVKQLEQDCAEMKAEQEGLLELLRQVREDMNRLQQHMSRLQKQGSCKKALATVVEEDGQSKTNVSL